MNASLFLNPVALAFAGIVIKAAVVVATAAVVTQVMRRRRRSAASVHLVWSMVIASLLMLPLLDFGLPGWGVVVATVFQPVSVAAPVAGVVEGPPPNGDLIPMAGTIDSSIGFGTTDVLLALYVLGAFALLLRIVLGYWQLAKLASRSNPVHDREWVALLSDLPQLVGTQRPVQLLYTGEVDIPMTWGTYRPVIFLPAGAQSWPTERRRAVLLHELAHVVRFDCLVQGLTSIACALYWFHPAVWYAARRLRVERERACDDQVILAGMTPRAYALELFEVAKTYRPGRMTAAAALGMARPSDLEARMVSLLDRVRRRGGISRRSLITATLGMIAVAVPIACLQPSVVVSNPASGDSPMLDGRDWAQPSSGWTQPPPDWPHLPTGWDAPSNKRDSVSGTMDPALFVSGSAFKCVGVECEFTNVEFRRNPESSTARDSSSVSSDSLCRANNQTYFEFQVDRKAEFVHDSTKTMDALPGTGSGTGGVVVQFEVDKRGSPELGSFKVLRSMDEGDVARVAAAFRQWRFTPALRQGCAARQLVQVNVLLQARYHAIP